MYIVLFIKQVGMEIVYGYRAEWQGSHTWVTVYVGGFVEQTCYGLMKAKVEVTFFIFGSGVSFVQVLVWSWGTSRTWIYGGKIFWMSVVISRDCFSVQ